MRRVILLSLFLILGLAFPARAQDQPVVVFVLNADLSVSSVFDNGPGGISALERVFQELGAETLVTNLIEPIPTEADLVVLVGPRERLSIVSLTRLWIHLARGKNLLLALDPPNYGGVEPEDFRSGFLNLLTNAYGLITTDSFLAAPWFSKDSAALLAGTYLLTHADVVPHPVIAPLLRYDLPVVTWAARALRVEPMGVDSTAVPLLQTESAFGETEREVFSLDAAAPPLELNIGVDLQGRLNIAGLGENSRLGSRIAVLGDAQMVQNGYGFAPLPGTAQPRHVGNQVFIGRLAAWLLELPEERWPGLPADFAWLAVDGLADDWNPELPGISEERNALIPPGDDIQQIKALDSSAYRYLLVRTFAAPSAGLTLRVRLADGTLITATPEVVTLPGGTLDDAALAVGEVIELRLPLRLHSPVEQVCLYDGDTERDCSAQPVRSNPGGREPFDLRFAAGPLATITSLRDVSLLDRPNGDTLTTLANGQMLSVTGRNAAGDWVQVRSGGLSGWLLASLAVLNADVNALPVVP